MFSIKKTSRVAAKPYPAYRRVCLTAVQTTRVNHIRHLVQFAKHAAQHLQVVDFDGHIDGGKLLAGIAAAGDAQHVDLLVGENGRDVAQQAAAVVGSDAHHQRVAGRIALTPDRFHDALRRMRLQLDKLVTVGTVNRNPASLSDKADDIVARNRLAAAGNVMHQVTYAFNHHAAVVFAALLRRIGFLLQLLQRRRVLLCRAWLIELRLQEVHHLIQTDITAANRR